MATSSQSYDRRRRISAALRRLMPSGGHTWTVPVITLLLLLGLVAGAVIMSTVTRRHVQLDDGTVWVTSLKNQKAARFNVKNKEADAGVSSSAPRFDIAQHNGDTILTETTKASTIKASTVSTGVKTDIKANTTTVVGGDTAALINEKTGNVWTGLSENLDSVTPTTSDPKIKLGEGGRIAVTHDGKVYGYRPSDGMVLRLDNPSSAKAKTLESLTDGKQQTVESFTVIGSTPVIATGKTVIFKGGRVDVDTTGTLTLQEPPTDDIQSDWVAAASPRGLALIPLKSNAKANFIANGGKANPARPVSSKGCVYSAWSQKASNYIRACSPTDTSVKPQTLESVNTTSELVFRTNHRLVVLNDTVNGNVWNPEDSTKVIKIQWNKIQTEQTEKEQQNNDSANNHHDFSKTCSAQSGQIKAEDDEIGARAGSEQILDALRNDEQTDCSVLKITKVGAPNNKNVTHFADLRRPVSATRCLRRIRRHRYLYLRYFRWSRPDLFRHGDRNPERWRQPRSRTVRHSSRDRCGAGSQLYRQCAEQLQRSGWRPAHSGLRCGPEHRPGAGVHPSRRPAYVQHRCAGVGTCGRRGHRLRRHGNRHRHGVFLGQAREHLGRGHRPGSENHRSQHGYRRQAVLLCAWHFLAAGTTDSGGYAQRRFDDHQCGGYVVDVQGHQSRHLLCALHHYSRFDSGHRIGWSRGAACHRRGRQTGCRQRCRPAWRG